MSPKIENSKTAVQSIPRITVEEDIPPNNVDSAECKLSTKEVDAYEKSIKGLERLQVIDLRNKAFKLIIVCVIYIIGLYVIDVFMINMGLQNSPLLSSLFELMKFLLSSLVGFVFAIKIIEK